MEEHAIDEMLYRSYRSQRDRWLDINTCNPKMLENIKSVYKEYIKFEKRYQNEKRNETTDCR